jgi:hypothetical protein
MDREMPGKDGQHADLAELRRLEREAGDRDPPASTERGVSGEVDGEQEEQIGNVGVD